MTFLWPSMLFALLVVPLVVVLYLRAQRRRQALTNTFYHLGGEPKVKGRAPGFRRHLPPALFLVSLVVILVALARPQAQVSLPRIEGTVMLVMDVSASMGATDVQPSRLEAAKTAARDFITSQPTTVKIGVVAFSGSGFTVQAPTNDSQTLLNTINRLQPTNGTSLGTGIATALHAIAVDDGLMPSTTAAAATPTPQPSEQSTPAPGPSQQNLLAQLPKGAYPASVIVLLTDGENTQSPDPMLAAQAAADHGVPVDALGFGTTAGATIKVDGYLIHTALDEGTLQQITQAAKGKYYPAPNAQDRKQVYASLTPQLVVKPEQMEITSIFAGASIVMMLVGSLFSVLWFNRLL